MAWLLFLVVVAGLAFYYATPDERARFFRACGLLAREVAAELYRRVTRRPGADGQPAPPFAFVTSAIVVFNLYVFVRMLFGAGAFADPETAIAWGGSIGPRTTNGEWWRLVTAMFVNAGWLHLVAMLAGLVQIGCLTERLVGRFMFAAVYISAGVLANVVCLFGSPVAVAAGASAPIFGVYALFGATWIWGLLRGSRVRVPWPILKRSIPGVALFLLYNAAAQPLGRGAVAAALAAGCVIGFDLARGTPNHRPAARRVAVVTAATAILAVLLAVPLWGMADVRPAIDRVLAVEARAVAAYEPVLARFNNGSVPAIVPATLIDGTIIPDLQAARAGIDALQRVPREHRALVSFARQYLQLREESWRLRAEGLRRLSMSVLRTAQSREREALQILETVRLLEPKVH